MDLNKSNPTEAAAEEGETAKMDPSDLEEEDVRDVSMWKGLEKFSSSEDEWNEDETNQAIFPLFVEDEESNGEETEKSILSLSEAAKKMDPSPLASFLKQVLDEDWYQPAKQIMKLIDYYGIQLSLVPSFQWVKMFEEYPLSKLIHVPLSLIPMPVISYSYACLRKINRFHQHASIPYTTGRCTLGL
ncbi:unnamed protein product [Eruca vesicaria subsp. sativa]|uniref:Uncharacterized protein n=1 Tax=Eruca vesicaria subsp. sativa TaxID=29727 RepID=A0ABC8ISM7_ERUVS|nr:unnamed protein product [Eruca vesicaria subsp. sativa]